VLLDFVSTMRVSGVASEYDAIFPGRSVSLGTGASLPISSIPHFPDGSMMFSLLAESVPSFPFLLWWIVRTSFPPRKSAGECALLSEGRAFF